MCCAILLPHFRLAYLRKGAKSESASLDSPGFHLSICYIINDFNIYLCQNTVLKKCTKTAFRSD